MAIYPLLLKGDFFRFGIQDRSAKYSLREHRSFANQRYMKGVRNRSQRGEKTFLRMKRRNFLQCFTNIVNEKLTSNSTSLQFF